MIELNKIHNDDCLTGMKEIPDKSVDLVLMDPPYNISIKGEKWDKWKTVDDYIAFMGTVLAECERVLKPTGSLYFSHNDLPQIAKIMEHIEENTELRFNSFIVWDKGDFRALSWKNPSEKNNLRSWFNTCEYFLSYTFESKTGLRQVLDNMETFPNPRKYFQRLQRYINLNKVAIVKEIGGRVDHAFRYESTQWSLPTPETYQALIDTYAIDKWDGFRPYESLRVEYESLRVEYESLRVEYESQRPVHNLDANHNNIWRSKHHNSGKLHPTQKPLDLMQRIIRTSSNPGDVVLDPFMGTGTTAVASINEGRNFIGFELNEKYHAISETRLKEEARPPEAIQSV